MLESFFNVQTKHSARHARGPISFEPGLETDSQWIAARPFARLEFARSTHRFSVNNTKWACMLGPNVLECGRAYIYTFKSIENIETNRNINTVLLEFSSTGRRDRRRFDPRAAVIIRIVTGRRPLSHGPVDFSRTDVIEWPEGGPFNAGLSYHTCCGRV